MTKRRTKTQKINMQRRREEKNQQQILIENLNKEKDDLLKRLEEQKNEYHKAKSVKNLNIFKSTLKLLYPYCLLGLAVPVPAVIFHGGLPFVIDSTKYYLEKTLDVGYDGEVCYQEDYVTAFWDDMNTFSNVITVTSAWTDNLDGTRSRTIREYKVNYSDELVQSILASDYQKTEELLGKHSSEIMESTNNDVNFDDTYHLEGSLGTIDYDSLIVVPETKEDNDLLTKLDIGLFILFSVIILKSRKFRYIPDIKKTYNDYNAQKNKYNVQNKNISMKVDKINQKILALKGNRGQINHE